MVMRMMVSERLGVLSGVGGDSILWDEGWRMTQQKGGMEGGGG